MDPRRTPWTLTALLAGMLAAAAGCSPPSNNDGDSATTGDGSSNGDGSSTTDGTPVGACGLDSDSDGIPDNYESNGDDDGDGTPNVRDTDSDNDGRLDGAEANGGRPYNCHMRPIDSDGDGNEDFRDTDSDNNGILDAADFAGTGDAPAGGWPANPVDTDMDGAPDYIDGDDDGDGISDAIEIAPGSGLAPHDEDHDGTPDYHDLDSDNDTIRDRDDGSEDADNDGTANFRDLDSDGDMITDAEEAGDNNLATAPVECPRELNVTTLMGVLNDGLADFRDLDSDNDGLTDHEEVMAGTDRCNPDTDGDGQLDSAEVAWCMQNHRTACATTAGTTIPTTDYYLILPNGGPVVARQLEFGTNIRVADVFFIFDTTGSMASVQRTVANTIATPMVGLVDSIHNVIPDTWFGVGHYDDFPTGGFGAGSDRAIHPLCDGPPDSSTSPGCTRPLYGGITMQGPDHSTDVQSMALALPGGGGSDLPEAANEALYQIVTNEGLFDHSDPSACMGTIGTAPCWVLPTNCAEDRWGYPCFRNGALAIVVNYTDAAFHNGARDQMPARTTYYSPYSGISPAPHNFDQMVQAYQRRSARQISINGRTGGSVCEGRFYTNHDMVAGNGPCYDFRMAAEGTGSVDLDGNPLIYDLPLGTGSGPPPADLVTQVTNAVNTLATRVPIDITTAVRNDATNPFHVDATRFVAQRTPACQVAPRNTMCWTEPSSVTHAQAVARTDLTTFYRVIPGTHVRFVVSFQNDGVFAGDASGIALFHALIDVMGDGVTRLDTRDVYILVPSAQPQPG